ncbi:hypothetical protein AAG570_006941 [Ranatra chinensis]|uniref:Uncharacterized protein n=1 Tax=Ranatra chinensis TaxID=642074 RepID=A0ABD0ZIU8_9HEMI
MTDESSRAADYSLHVERARVVGGVGGRSPRCRHRPLSLLRNVVGPLLFVSASLQPRIETATAYKMAAADALTPLLGDSVWVVSAVTYRFPAGRLVREEGLLTHRGTPGRFYASNRISDERAMCGHIWRRLSISSM